MFAAAGQITGWSGWRGSLFAELRVCARGVFREGYRGVTAGSGGGGRRAGVGSYDLKEHFFL